MIVIEVPFLSDLKSMLTLCTVLWDKLVFKKVSFNSHLFWACQVSAFLSHHFTEVTDYSFTADMENEVI